MTDTRHLIDRLWELTSSDRREICLELGLITPDEIRLPEPRRYQLAIVRAAERNQVDRLDQMVSERGSA